MTEIVEMNLVAREQSPAAMYKMAVDTGQDLAQAEKAMELQERWEKNEARKAYHKAMAAFKKDPPKIDKDKKVAYKEVRYSHASLANVTNKINEALSAQGLSASWSTSQENGSVTVTCTVTHELGHSESTSLTAAPDTSGSKNSIQAIGSTVSYLQRYTILALTGLATSDMDDDGNATSGTVAEFITPEQAAALNKELVKFPDQGKAFLEYVGAETTDTIYAGAQYKKALQGLKAAKKAGESK